MSATQIAALAGLMTAIGTLVASITALIVGLKAHQRINGLQGQGQDQAPPAADRPAK